MDRTCPVRRIGLNGGLVLNLEDSNELVTSRPLRLSLPVLGTHPAEDVMIDLDDVPNHLPPLLNFSGSVCTQSSCDDDGTLHVELSNGHRITVDADEDFTTWELYGKHHGYMACLSHGRFRVVRHDLPEDHQVADLSAIAR